MRLFTGRRLYKMTTFFTHCNWHLGDHLAHLHYLRKQAIHYPEHRFVHAANFDYLPQLIEVISDLSNISLIDIEYKPEFSQDAWKNREWFIERHVNKSDYAAVYIDFFKYLSSKLGLESPIHTASDLLFDYPAILKKRYASIDFLVFNNVPLSQQFIGFNPDDFDDLIGKLIDHGYSVVTTAPSVHNVPCTQHNHLSISAIGGLSLSCKYVVGICNGPTWPTFNIWNTESVLLRVLLLDHDHVSIAPNTEHARTMFELLNILRSRDLL